MSDISLTASMRSNLLSLQNTQSLMDTTQERLSTGKKVNSALDNPSSFYTAQSLTNRASDLSSLLDSMGQGIQTIKAADEAITSITEFVQQAKAIANQARDEADKSSVTSTGEIKAEANANAKLKIGNKELTVNLADTDNDATKVAQKIQTAITGDTGGVAGKYTAAASADGKSIVIKIANGAEVEAASVSFEGAGIKISGTLEDNRASYVDRYNDILTQIDQLAKDAGYKGVNLLGGTDQSLTVVFNEDRSSSLTIKGVDGSAAGLGLTPETDWSTNAGIDAALTKIDSAISSLRSMSSEFGNNYSVVQTREEFTENLINVLEEGADKLTLADMNEESANMLALQTRQQLAINSLSLASQAAQSVLKLF
ncbi:MAG: flagellin [Alphaproteobacteria bacterium]